MKLLPPEGHFTTDDVMNKFLESLIDSGVEPYDHQEEAILEIFSGNNVILNTPTGSGKSLVALAMHYKSFCEKRISYYTVPIKALANEKFLSLCQTFGPENVGMITGDATVNASAAIICCTAEILSNLALREGSKAMVHDVIMDEFHYYSDLERGVAWQIPLLTLPQCRFLLMSATIGDTTFFQKTLTELTGAETILVQSDQRPVPLEFTYSEIPLSEQVTELVEKNKSPVYLVHFAQRAVAESAQNLMSSNFCSKEEKRAISEALQDANFRSPYGKEVSKLLRHGIGIHHAGLLPKYRILVEKLTQQGLLKVICGTDTLGVGVNVPIRSVLFTQLCKYDGSGTKILSVRDFKQISGRAGRRGFDDIGYVVAQAPEHVIDNIRLEAKAAASAKNKKVVKKKPPEKGYVAWDTNTFLKLQTSPPEPLVSSFKLRHNLMLNVLSRPDEDGCAELKRIIRNSHETETSKANIRRQAREMFMALVRGKILTILPPTERATTANPPKVTLNVDLQDDFTMNQTLGLYLIETIPLLDQESPDYALNLLSLIESILESPAAILKAQVNEIKSTLVNEMKADGIEYDQRMERLDEVTHPMPGKDFIYDTFNAFRLKHPWVGSEGIRPKSIAREMFEDYMSFEDYIQRYKLERSEAILLRALSEVYKTLSQTVPPALKTEEVYEAETYLREHLTSVDSSLIDEWEMMRDPDYVPSDQRNKEESSPQERPISHDKKKFTKLVHHAVFTAVKHLSHDNLSEFLSCFNNRLEFTPPKLDELLNEYYLDHIRIRLDPEARNLKHCHVTVSEDFKTWKVSQTLCDPDNLNDWVVAMSVDLEKSNIAGEVILSLLSLEMSDAFK
ncbi:MAG: DEAD/DEAH box helicase [Akkermansiaceae bacterium]